MLNLLLAIVLVVMMAGALVWLTWARALGWDRRAAGLWRRLRGKTGPGARRRRYYIQQ